jgi:hypothetical protein
MYFIPICVQRVNTAKKIKLIVGVKVLIDSGIWRFEPELKFSLYWV